MILLTGFEPFGGETANPSWAAARSAARQLQSEGLDVQAVELPCVFGASARIPRRCRRNRWRRRSPSSSEPRLRRRRTSGSLPAQRTSGQTTRRPRAAPAAHGSAEAACAHWAVSRTVSRSVPRRRRPWR
ncbi:hypothetical protein ACFVTM_15980 [Arthrobacter sp. NPDC058130]|uniref:pyroglutamyl-peptidase I family protein n=1 Tax=Arthrobacter sp. NPDC058130 TaxID=3346353 RepID=UPI0036E76D3E